MKTLKNLLGKAKEKMGAIRRYDVKMSSDYEFPMAKKRAERFVSSGKGGLKPHQSQGMPPVCN